MKVCSICQRCYADDVEVCRQDGDELVETGGGDPEMVPGYLLIQRIGVTRYTETYYAEENTSGSECIVKLFSSTDAERILLEAKTVKALFNAGLIGVYDSGSIGDGRVFIVTECANGQSLRHLLTTVGPPNLLASVEIIREVAETLHALHENGVTHGAINPENIFLSSGAVLIDNIDYGRTTERSVTSNKFEVDSHIDVLRYFSPEQCTSDERTPQSDIYSLGIIFYELLAGSPPFDSDKAVELIDKHRHERPQDVKINNFELRMLITHALSESLQKQPRFRQSSADLFARQLRHIEQLATHSSTPPPAVKSATRVVPASTPRIEIYQPAPATKIADPDITHVAPRTRIETKPKSIEPADVIPVEVVEITDSTPAIKVETPAPAIAVEASTTAPKRSRLRSLKRKLHTLSAAVASSIERGTLASIAGELASLATKDDTPSEKAPRKIEWIQPEDDIPSVADVVKTLATEGITGADITLATPQEQPRAVSSLISLNLVSETSKVPTLPVVETVEQVIAKPVELSEPVIAPAPEPEVVKEKPVEKLPAKPVVVAAPAKVASSKSKVVTQRAQPMTSVAISPQRSAVVVTQPHYADGDEEITLVRPPRRLRIDLEKPRTIYRVQTAYARSAADISFQPTMIEPRKQKRSRPAPAPEVQDGMFSGHFGWSSSLTDVKYRAMAIGVGCVVLATLFLFANDAVSRFFQNVTPGDSATAKATSSEVATETSPAVDPTFKPTRASLRTSSETPPTETKPTKIVEESKPASKTSSDREKPKETLKAASKSSQEKPIQKRAEPEPVKKQPVTRPAFPDLGRPSGATRPRIVSDPQP